MIVITRKKRGVAIPEGAKGPAVSTARQDILGADAMGAKRTVKNAMNVGVGSRAAERARCTQVIQSGNSTKVRLEVISQMKQEVLASYLGFNNGRRRARKIQPAEIASDRFQVKEHLAGAHR